MACDWSRTPTNTQQKSVRMRHGHRGRWWRTSEAAGTLPLTVHRDLALNPSPVHSHTHRHTLLSSTGCIPAQNALKKRKRTPPQTDLPLSATTTPRPCQLAHSHPCDIVPIHTNTREYKLLHQTEEACASNDRYNVLHQTLPTPCSQRPTLHKQHQCKEQFILKPRKPCAIRVLHTRRPDSIRFWGSLSRPTNLTRTRDKMKSNAGAIPTANFRNNASSNTVGGAEAGMVGKRCK
jgi:hypothetical protein